MTYLFSLFLFNLFFAFKALYKVIVRNWLAVDRHARSNALLAHSFVFAHAKILQVNLANFFVVHGPNLVINLLQIFPFLGQFEGKLYIAFEGCVLNFVISELAPLLFEHVLQAGRIWLRNLLNFEKKRFDFRIGPFQFLVYDIKLNFLLLCVSLLLVFRKGLLQFF